MIDTQIGENSDDEMPPSTWASLFVRESNGNLVTTPITEDNGIGTYYALDDTWGGLAPLRGGAFSFFAEKNVGIFSLNLSYSPWDIDNSIGFRCVYRP